MTVRPTRQHYKIYSFCHFTGAKRFKYSTSIRFFGKIKIPLFLLLIVLKNKKSEKVKKSKCNKPKYAATHHAECKKIDMKSVIVKKCLKKKYQNKHKMRCSFMARNDHPIKENEIFSEVIDKRCRKESFR